MTDYEELKYKRAKKWISDLDELAKYGDLDEVFLSIFEEKHSTQKRSKMKTEEQIITNLETTKKKIQNEIELVNMADSGSVIEKVHWEHNIRLQGYRDALEWILKEEK